MEYFVFKTGFCTKIYFTACSTKAKYILRAKIKLVYQEQYYMYEIMTPRPIFLSGIQNQIWYVYRNLFPSSRYHKMASRKSFQFIFRKSF